MDLLPLHPKIVHLPIALSVLLPLITGGVLLAWLKGWLPKRAFWMAIALHGLLAASGFAAMLTGEAEEERVEEVVTHATLEAHEEAAELFVYASAFVFLLALGAGVVRHEKASRGLAAATFAGTLALLGLGYRVGEAGGRLVYAEGAASAYTTPAATGGTEAGGASAPPEGRASAQGDEDDDD